MPEFLGAGVFEAMSVLLAGFGYNAHTANAKTTPANPVASAHWGRRGVARRLSQRARLGRCA